MPEIAKGPWEAHSQTSRHDHAVLPHDFLLLASETLVQDYGRNVSTLKPGGGVQICRLEGMVGSMTVMSEKIMNTEEWGNQPRGQCVQGPGRVRNFLKSGS